MSSDVAADLPRLAVFDGCPSDVLGDLRPPLEELDVEPGETIVREGHIGHEWYVVLAGAVEALRGTAHVGDLGPGDHFGEIALLYRQPRTVTIRATVPTRVLLVPESSFNTLLAAAPSFSARIRRAAELRRTYLEQVSSSPG